MAKNDENGTNSPDPFPVYLWHGSQIVDVRQKEMLENISSWDGKKIGKLFCALSNADQISSLSNSRLFILKGESLYGTYFYCLPSSSAFIRQHFALFNILLRRCRGKIFLSVEFFSWQKSLQIGIPSSLHPLFAWNTFSEIVFHGTSETSTQQESHSTGFVFKPNVFYNTPSKDLFPRWKRELMLSNWTHLFAGRKKKKKKRKKKRKKRVGGVENYLKIVWFFCV